MLQVIPLDKRNKTDATIPVESESTPSGLQTDEVPIGGASGIQATEPVLDIQPLRVVYPTETTTEPSQKDSVAPKGKRTRRLVKLSELPTDTETQPTPAKSSKKG